MRSSGPKSAVRRAGGAVAAVVAAGLVSASLADDGPSGAGEEAPLVALGRRLFHDPAVSRDGRHACASCHDPEHGWSDARQFSADERGPTRRHSQPIADLRFGAEAGFHWDGEFAHASDIVTARIGDPREALSEASVRAGEVRRLRAQVAEAAKAVGAESGATTTGDDDEPTDDETFGAPVSGGYGMGPITPSGTLPLPIPERIAMDRRYDRALHEAFGTTKIDSRRIVWAVSEFVASLATERNALDAHLGGDATALSPAAVRGLELFRGKAACATCHTLDREPDGRVRLTDGRSHNTGVATAQFERAQAELVSQFRGLRGNALQQLVDRLGGPEKAAALRAPKDPGRRGRTAAGPDHGAFKTPSLRDVARRAPYMHDGSLATLEDVVAYYAKGGTPNAHLDAGIRPLALSAGESQDLVAFLRSLDGADRAGTLPVLPEARSMRVKIVDPVGRAVPRLQFAVVPAGEFRRGGGSAALDRIVQVRTSQKGEAVVTFPQSTHVRLGSVKYEIAGGTPIPDTCDEMEVTAAPLDRITIVFESREDRGAAEALPYHLEGTVDPFLTAQLTRRTASASAFRIPDPAGQPAATEPETFRFVRLRTLGEGRAVYSAALGKSRDRSVLRFPSSPGTFDRLAVIDLAGGWSEAAPLERARPSGVIGCGVPSSR